MEDYEQKKRRLSAQMHSARGGVRLAKPTSNLFRERDRRAPQRLDVRDFDQVLEVNAQGGWIEAEGMTRYDRLVEASLAEGLLPTVVPQLRSITLGGAAAGVGIEASSFRYGLVHETLLEMDILLADGRVVTCTQDNAHRDLFFGFPNSYGTLGYALRLKVRCVPAKPYVRLEHIRHRNGADYFRDLEARCDQAVDFLDGVVFADDELYLTSGRFAEEAPFLSDYSFEQIYYRSIRKKQIDYLTARDYIWRWDTDWFWCSKNLYAQNPLVRRLLGPSRLNSVTYTKIMRWNSRWRLKQRLERLFGVYTEGVIQDVDIPLPNAAEFLDFFQREIGITPIWICPIRPCDPAQRFDLYPLVPRATYVNFGFWDRVRVEKGRPAGYLNRKVERKVAELGGIKSLYSDSYYSHAAFWSIYDYPAYRRLKAKYDPEGRLKDLYEKCVLRR